MANRYTEKERLFRYRYLVNRDGEICALCGKPPKEPGTLDIDHKDNDKTNDNPENLQLAHPTCNRRKEIENRGNGKKTKIVTVSLEGSPATRIVRSQVNYLDGSVEMQANCYFETAFRKWLIEQIIKKQGVDIKEAKNSGAEVVGCSPATISRYIDKLLSQEGPLQLFEDAIGTKYLMFKDHILKSIADNEKTYKRANGNGNGN